LKGH